MVAAVTESNETLRPGQEHIDELILRMSKGDTGALAEFYDCTRAAVFGYVLSFMKNVADTEDVLHDCYVNIYTRAGTYKSQGNPFGWILTIAKNLCLKKFSEDARTAPADDDSLKRRIEKRAASNGASAEEMLILRTCLEELSPEDQRIVVLHAVAGLKHREIGELLDLPLSTVLSKYDRALDKLNNLLRED